MAIAIRNSIHFLNRGVEESLNSEPKNGIPGLLAQFHVFMATFHIGGHRVDDHGVIT